MLSYFLNRALPSKYVIINKYTGDFNNLLIL